MNAISLAARALGATAFSAAVLCGASPAWAATGTGPSQSSLEAQAQQLAGQIRADGRQLDQLAEEFNAAQMRYQQLTAQEARLALAMAATDRSVAVARHVLKEQAILAYLAGGAPFNSYIPSRPDTDPSLKVSYAEIVSGGEKRAVASYRAALDQQRGQEAQLADARRQATITLDDVRSDQAAADATLASQRQALSQVKGQLAVLVAQAQAARQKAEQAAVRANLVSQGRLAAAPATTAAPSTTTTTAPGTPAPTVSRAPAPAPAPTTTTTTTPPPPPSNPPASGADRAIQYARAQLGKPYQWGGAGPNSFDCSGLTMMAWEQAGVYFPHLAQAQYDMTARVAISNLLPGDLVFYGTPSNVYHVGLYIGNGDMIDAPATGQVVSIQSIFWDGLLGGGRVSS